MSVLIKGITLEQFYRDLNNVRDMDVDWDIVQLSDDVVEREKGKWIAIDELNVHNSDGYYIGDQIECQCSICGKNVWLFETEKDYNFCPYCDADMRRTK